jgi:hypothetical protein
MVSTRPKPSNSNTEKYMLNAPRVRTLIYFLRIQYRKTAISLSLMLLLLNAQATAETVPPQADLLFDLAGPAACELPPASFGAEAFAAVAQSTDPARSRGQLTGAINANLTGLATYGRSAQGGLAVGFQGGYVSDDNRVALLCALMVRVGPPNMPLGESLVVGEAGLASAPDGAFLGVFKIITRDSAGGVASLAKGEVKQGKLMVSQADPAVVSAAKAPPAEYLAGKLVFDGVLLQAGTKVQGKAFRLEATMPIAINAIRRLPQLKRTP